MKLKFPFLALCLALQAYISSAADRFVSYTPSEQALRLTGTNDTILYDSNDWKGVQMAVTNLRQDLQEVTGSPTAPIIVATVGKSPLAKQYAAQSKALKGKTEQYLLFTDQGRVAAQNNQGWRLPTAEECHALIMKCRSEWTSVNGVYGRTYARKGNNSGETLFVPATGLVTDEREAVGHAGFFWTSSATDAEHAYYFYVYSGEHHLFVDRKAFRYPILLVVKK